MVRVRENINVGKNTSINQSLSQEEKLIEQMKEYLKGPKWWNCVRGDEKQRENQLREFYERIGINTLSHWSNLLPYYQNEPNKSTILNELKEKLEKIKNNKLPWLQPKNG